MYKISEKNIKFTTENGKVEYADGQTETVVKFHRHLTGRFTFAPAILIAMMPFNNILKKMIKRYMFTEHREK